MRFPPPFIEELKHRLAVSEVVGRSVQLKKAGREHQGLCPFHKEKTPSFTVSDEKGFYHCFGCGAHGDAIKFVMEQQGLSYPEAVERLAGEAGMALPAYSPQEAKKYEKLASLQEVVELACSWFQKQLLSTEGQRALRYLQERGVSRGAIAQFRLGYAPDSRNALKEFLAGKGVTAAQMLEAGLVIQPEQRLPYDRFRGRVIFPIFSPRGRVIAFGGRILAGDGPKYLNSPETPLFHKGRTLYGLPFARQPAHQAGRILITEGYMDVIALQQAGFGETVAPLGTAVTEGHLQMLWRMAPEPVLCLDGDSAGQRAMERAAELALPLLRPGFSLRFAVLPTGQDPDDLIRNAGPAAFKQLLHSCRTLADVVWQLAAPPAAGQATPDATAAFERRLQQLIARISDPTVQKHYRQHLQDRFWRFRKHRQAKEPARQSAVSPHSPSRLLLQMEGRPGLPERLILAAILNHPELLDHAAIEERLSAVSFSHHQLDKMRRSILELHVFGAFSDSDGLISQLQEGFTGELESLLSQHNLALAPFAATQAQEEEALAGLEDCLLALEKSQARQEQQKALETLGEEVDEESWEKFLALRSRLEEEKA